MGRELPEGDLVGQGRVTRLSQEQGEGPGSFQGQVGMLLEEQ